jgi:serine/threonine protein kinase
MRIEYLEKKGGARLNDVATFKVACRGSVCRKTYARRRDTLQAPIDDFGHVFIGKVGDSRESFVVKVYSVDSTSLRREIDVYNRLQGTPFERYTPKTICHFSPSCVCLATGGTPELHFIVMEYIEHAEFDRFMASASIEAIRSMTVQTLLMIADLMLNYKIVHSDINSGNILIRQTSKKENAFNIDGKTYRVKTHGYMPMLVDFGLSYIKRKSIKTFYAIEQMSMVVNLVHVHMNKEYSAQRKVLYDFIFKNCEDFTVQEYVERVRTILKV